MQGFWKFKHKFKVFYIVTSLQKVASVPMSQLGNMIRLYFGTGVFITSKSAVNSRQEELMKLSLFTAAQTEQDKPPNILETPLLLLD
jgi:hypothetical protein